MLLAERIQHLSVLIAQCHQALAQQSDVDNETLMHQIVQALSALDFNEARQQLEADDKLMTVMLPSLLEQLKALRELSESVRSELSSQLHDINKVKRAKKAYSRYG